MSIVKINNCDYNVNLDEYCKIIRVECENLHLYNNLDIHETLIGFIKKILNIEFDDSIAKKFIHINPSHGGFIGLNINSLFCKTSLVNVDKHKHLSNIKLNINNFKINNIDYDSSFEDTLLKLNGRDFVIILNDDDNFNILNINLDNYIIISKYKLDLNSKYYYHNDSEYHVYISKFLEHKFNDIFHHYLKHMDNNQTIINYDNLLQLCIMVKNAGPQFRNMLEQNIQFFDKWTILDTGSTDDTIQIINDVLINKKEGNLYEEPFINFRDSRNRLLDLAGTECKYIVMLDDTYILKGDIRSFLKEIRSDQTADSFSLFIESNDTKYGSNRIIKSNTGLRYKFRIHEIINDKDNLNIIVPFNKAYILDERFDYMEKRTMDRKKLDIQLLYEELEENPHEPRTYYYLGQTYNLMNNYDKAFYYLMKRSDICNSGFIQERIDATFEAARIANFKLNKPWEEVEQLYLKTFKMDESRPESIYFIGIHYYLENNYSLAHKYFKQAFHIGFPEHCQYGLKPTLSFYYLPKFLCETCYYFDEYELGLESCKLFIQHNTPEYINGMGDEAIKDYEMIVSWYKIFEKLNEYKGKKIARIISKPILCFVADGGFSTWSGENIKTTGVGGSETYIIEMAKYLSQTNYFGEVIVFCNTPNKEEKKFEGTRYIHLDYYYEFINTTYVNTVIISRYSEYLPVTIKGFSENIYVVVHDLTTSGRIIPKSPKIKQIFCLTEWHTNYFTSFFSDYKSITTHLYYGIDEINFRQNINKIKNKFIYSSFPNRGLLQLLELWPHIFNKYPDATLYIYTDVNNAWSNNVEPDKLNKIKNLLHQYSDKFGIFYKGWVSKKELADSWATADIWFYPCTFQETFCLTALEAAISKTFVVTNGLAALQNTVSNRGIIIEGDPTTDEWKLNALNTLFYYMDDSNAEIKQNFIERNYNWAHKLTWKNQADKLLNEFILPNNTLEYRGMINWTNNINDTFNQFMKIIDYFNNSYWKIKFKKDINVLQVGAWTGTSLIKLIQSIPNSKGIGIDLWKNRENNYITNNTENLDIKGTFYRNIKTTGLYERISGIQMESKKVLINFIKDKKGFDFIFIDGSYSLYDVYTEIILAWEILESDGIMAIDYYNYNIYNDKFTISFESIDNFLKLYEGQYNLLSKDYCVFLQKI